MATLRHLLVLAGCALAMVATAAISQLPNSGGATSRTRAQVAPQNSQLAVLGFDYQLAGNQGAFQVQAPVPIASTIPEPPFGASVAGAALIGLVVWTRRRRT